MCNIDDCDERYSVYYKQVKRARKEHKCCECRRAIAPGEPYQFSKGLYDGTWDTWHMCQHCLIGAEWLVEQCGGYVYASVREEIREHADEYKSVSFALNKFYVGARQRWLKFDRSGLMPVLRPLPPPDYV